MKKENKIITLFFQKAPLELMLSLSLKEQTFGDLVNKIKISKGYISKLIKKFRSLNLVKVRIKKKKKYVKLLNTNLQKLFKKMNKILKGEK